MAHPPSEKLSYFCTKMKVTISILTYNRSKYLKKLLTSLISLDYKPFEIIVIDNHSEDDTQQMMTDEFPYISYIRTERNIGAEARNLGMKKALGDIIITLDDDIIGLDDDAILNIVKWFSADTDLGALNFKVIDALTGGLCNWVHHYKPEDYSHKDFITYEITEGAVAFRKLALERSGYYPENFFLSHEGPDLAFRLLENGLKVIYSSEIVVEHYTANEGRTSWRNYYFDTRNQFLLAARNFPVGYALRYLTMGLAVMLAYSIRDGYTTYWLKAVYDGVKGLGAVLKDRKVLSKNTMAIIKNIDSNKPNLAYLVRRRLFRRGIRI